MDPELLKALIDLPVTVVLIFLLYRESAQKEKLLMQLLEQAKQHSENLIEMVKCGFANNNKE